MTHSFYRSYGFPAAMLGCIVLGCAVGAAWPGAVCLEPLGTVFINMMFCLVVPLVFCSLAGSIANTRARGAGRGASSARRSASSLSPGCSQPLSCWSSCVSFPRC